MQVPENDSAVSGVITATNFVTSAGDIIINSARLVTFNETVTANNHDIKQLSGTGSTVFSKTVSARKH